MRQRIGVFAAFVFPPSSLCVTGGLLPNASLADILLARILPTLILPGLVLKDCVLPPGDGSLLRSQGSLACSRVADAPQFVALAHTLRGKVPVQALSRLLAQRLPSSGLGLLIRGRRNDPACILVVHHGPVIPALLIILLEF